MNGNVINFQIMHNVVHDDNNIGIDMIGGESSIFGLSNPRPGLPVTRDGVCSHNTVYDIHANYGGGFAAGIYVDGGQNITLADNVSYHNDLGLEVGAENAGYVASRITVENNLLYLNTQAGLVFGGYDQSVGRTKNCNFINNTVYRNDTLNTGNGQLWIQWASSNVVTNNIFYAAANNVLIGSDGGGNVGNLLDHNLYFAASGANNSEFDWNSATYDSFAAYRKGTGEDAHSIFADPKFVNAGAFDFHLAIQQPGHRRGEHYAGPICSDRLRRPDSREPARYRRVREYGCVSHCSPSAAVAERPRAFVATSERLERLLGAQLGGSALLAISALRPLGSLFRLPVIDSCRLVVSELLIATDGPFTPLNPHAL